MIKLNHGLRREAVCRAEEIAGHDWIRDTDNYTDLATPDRWLAGAIGEIGVREWAKFRGLEYEETSNTDGLPDSQDFLFPFKSGKTARVNVKCTLHPRGIRLMQPMAQFEKHCQQDLYIGCTAEDTGMECVVLLWGVIQRKTFEEQADRLTPEDSGLVKVPSLVFPLSKMPYKMEQFARNVRVKT
jgi:hypothetical protein